MRAPRAVHHPLAVRVLCAPDDDPPRVAYAIGRAVGPAVARNRVRRRLRAAMQELRDLLAAGCSYLVTARPGAEVTAYRDLVTALRTCLVELQPS
jgi:ribonuclease P protein component